MKMGDGGFRPAYNVQLATDGSPMGGPRTIVGLRVTIEGTDMGSLPTAHGAGSVHVRLARRGAPA